MIDVGFVGFEKRKKVIDIFRHMVNKFSKEEIMINKISAENISNENVDFKKYNIIIFEADFFERQSNKIINFANLSPNSILVVNYDDKSFLKIVRGEIFKLITYGFNNKSCITASSVQDGEEYLCCIQRSFCNFLGKAVEPHEIRVIIKKYRIKNIYTILILISAILMCGIDCISEDKIIL